MGLRRRYRLRSREALRLGGLILVASGVVGLGAGCPDEDEAGEPDGGGPKIASSGPALEPVDSDEPLAAIRPHLEARTGWCVQIRSLSDKAEAEALIARVEDETGQVATALPADLGERGTWYRICVGAEPSRRQASRLAAKWTRKGGLLARYMDKPKRGQARYFLKERTAASARAPSEAQARLLLAAEPGDDRRVLLARRGAKAEFLGATTRPPDERGHTEVVLVDHAGRRISFPEGPPPGCAPCRAALRESPVASRLALSVGDLTDGPAEAIVVQEETEAGDRFLVVLQAGDPVVTASGVWLGRDREGLRIVTQVEAVEADTDDERELAVVRSELPVVDDKLCAVRTSVDIHDLGEERPVKLDERYAARLAGAPEGIDLPRRVATLTSALDRLGDPKSASRVCRAVVARADDPEVTRHCMRRVSALLGRGDAIAAVNAGGLLAELDEKLRPAVAPLLYEAVKAVDEDPRLAVQPEDCTARPLVTAFSSRSLDDNLRIAEATLADRVDLGDVVDAVYVTGHRDFGAQTPVGGITTRWLARLKSALPGRHAAIEALLTPAPAVGGGP